MISLTGAGGKTTLMFRLAEELKERGKRVVTTTTTKILEPSPEESPHLFISGEQRELLEFAKSHLDRYRHITLALERLEGRKLKGIPPEFADDLWEKVEVDFILVEADGAAGRPVKAPRTWEPVLPSKTTTVIGLVGLDGIGKKLNEEEVFQPALISNLTGIPMGEEMTEEGVVRLIVHPEGIFKGAPPSVRRIAFLNKVDIPNGLALGKRVARGIVEKGCPMIERIVLGTLREGTKVADVILPLGAGGGR
ncbi:MAG: selenium cofactor biosynthesis protein YqeC [Desulfobacterota bacterium]|nr:selenium cofactor biosynthesis protein YqeC [Thermodesulfobacteriota bacterium]